MRKIFALLLAALLVLSVVSISANAEISVVLNNEPMEFEVAPIIINDRTLVPFRAIFEALGAEVEWRAETQTIVAEITNIHQTTITLQIGNDTMRVETLYLWIGMPTDEPRPAIHSSTIDISLDVPPMIMNNRTLVPIRAVSESLGAIVDWDRDTQTIVICTLCGDVPGNFHQTITAQQAYSMINELTDFILLDVRTSEEFLAIRIDGAILIPYNEIADRAAAELPDKNAVILIYCRSGRRSANAARSLADMGYTNVYDFGGIIDWPFDADY